MQHLVHSVIDSDSKQKIVPVAVLRVEELGLYGIAESRLPGQDGKASAQIVLDAIRSHVTLHQDLIERFRLSPSDMLRNEILTVLREAVSRAGQEAFALLRRKGKASGVGVDILVITEKEAFAAHVGHGQIFLLRRDLLHHLTITRPDQDKTTELPRPRVDHALPFVHLGEEPRVHVEALCLSFAPGDRIIVASGSLAQTVDDRDIRSFSGALPPPQAIQGLLHLAREKAPTLPMAVLVMQAPSGSLPNHVDTQTRLAILSRMPLFSYCNQDELHSVASVALPRSVTHGERIFTQGEAGHEIFLVVHGEIAIIRDGVEVARVGEGTNFGEMAMLDEPFRSATAMAVMDTELLIISRETFFGLLMGNPTLAVKILWNMLLKLSDNLRRTTVRLAEVSEIGTPPGTKLKPTDVPW